MKVQLQWNIYDRKGEADRCSMRRSEGKGTGKMGGGMLEFRQEEGLRGFRFTFV